MATQLGIYNGALRLCGERSLASLAENREPRRLCDDVWNDGFVDDVLSDGFWKFACRTIASQYDPNLTPPFGYRRGFTYPTDAVRLRMVSMDEYFNVPLTRYEVEAKKIYADLDTIYLSYISNDASYGGDLSGWSQNFNAYCKAYLAKQIVHKLTQDKERMQLIEKEMERALTEAQSQDAMEGPAKFPPKGTWSRSRQGRFGRTDRGRTSQLIG